MRTVIWKSDGPAVQMIDQRDLPHQYTVLEIRDYRGVTEAIKNMAVRGAPAIGAAAAYGLTLAAYNLGRDADDETLRQGLQQASHELRSTRPTAVNLGWALDRMLEVLDAAPRGEVEDLQSRLLQEAERLADQDVEINQSMASHGARLLKDPSRVLHHCNTGALATVDYGTALGVIRFAHETGKSIEVLVDETRPRLQGARLTAWELQQYGIPYKVITDSAAGSFLQRGLVDAVLVGADRVAGNGDIVNKIGTYMLALAAQANEVPFYVVAPTSTVDLQIPAGHEVPIEERAPSEVLDIEMEGKPTHPLGAEAANPAFDVTPHQLVTAIVTEVGVIRPPYSEGLTLAVEEARKRWMLS